MTHTSTEQQIAAAWNAQADKFNQWDELDFEEKIEWAAKWGAMSYSSGCHNAQDPIHIATLAYATGLTMRDYFAAKATP